MTPRPRRLLGVWLAALAVIAVTIPARAGSFCPAGTRRRDGELHGSRRTWCETRDGVAHGPFAVWHPGGVLALAGWREGDLVLGTLTTWYADGHVESMMQVTPQGYSPPLRHWRRDGSLVSTVDPLPDGRFLALDWHRNGRLERWETYGRDGSGYRIQWYENGQRRHEGAEGPAGPEGMQQEWWPNGEPRSIWLAHFGRAEGLQRTWHENGRLRSEGEMHQGHPVARWRFWRSDGSLAGELDGGAPPNVREAMLLDLAR